MAYDRSDRGGDRDDRWRWSDDRHDRERSHRSGEERGFFERAGEEISSWFGGREESGGQHRGDEHRGHRGYDRERENWMRDRPQPERAREGRDDDDDRRYRPMRWSTSREDYRQERGSGPDRDHRSSERDFWDRHGREQWNDQDDRRGYRPMAGDYGRSGERRDRSRPGMSQGSEPRGFDRSESEYGRDDYRRTSFAGSSARSNHDDPHYDEMRRRHMDEFDRDYGEYRREQGSRFESDFGGWREQRESKRGLLGRVKEHMEVVGSDGKHVGTIDRVAGDRLILTKSDPDSGGTHHSLSCTAIDRVEDDRVILGFDADRARDRWRDDNRDRALFEREDQGSAGPHMLDRSFSGTYR